MGEINAWGNTTSRTGTRWNTGLPSFTATWTNGRNTNATYDAAGNQTASYAGATTQSQRYDAAGRASSNTLGTSVFGVNNDVLGYDGDGRVVRQVTEARINSNPFSTAKRHYVRASVLGGVILSEILDKGSLLGNDPNRFENQSNMYLQGERIAYQKYTDRIGPDKEVVWVYKHPVIGSLLETNKLTRPDPYGGSPAPLEYTLALNYFDPLGANLGFDPATLPPPVQIDDPLLQASYGDITNYSSGCAMDGVRTNCNIVQSMLNNGWAIGVPEGESGLMWNPAAQAWQSHGGFVVDWDNGFFGFVPQGATYGGNGGWNWNRPKGSLDDDEAPDGRLSPIPGFQQNDLPPITYEHKFISQAVFIKCYEEHLENTGIKNTPFDRGRATLALAASKGHGDDAAMVAAIWHKESFLNYRPDGDAGPAQLTSWWRKNHPELIVGDSYGNWNGRTTTPFDGNPVDNVTTLGNIVAFTRGLYNGSYPQVAYWYGPGDPVNPKNAPKKRAEYRDQVMPNFDLYRRFFSCILQQ